MSTSETKTAALQGDSMSTTKATKKKSAPRQEGAATNVYFKNAKHLRMIQRAAKLLDVSVSAFIRRAALEAAIACGITPRRSSRESNGVRARRAS
jgi:hypothetical protein